MNIPNRDGSRHFELPLAVSKLRNCEKAITIRIPTTSSLLVATSSKNTLLAIKDMLFKKYL
jgi:hypothetical protein